MSSCRVFLDGPALNKALERAGFVVRRQEGSHVILRRSELTINGREACIEVDAQAVSAPPRFSLLRPRRSR